MRTRADRERAREHDAYGRVAAKRPERYDRRENHLQRVRRDHDALARTPVAGDTGEEAEEHVRKRPDCEHEACESGASATVQDDPGKRDEREADPEVVAELGNREQTAVARLKERVDGHSAHARSLRSRTSDPTRTGVRSWSVATREER